MAVIVGTDDAQVQANDPRVMANGALSTTTVELRAFTRRVGVGLRGALAAASLLRAQGRAAPVVVRGAVGAVVLRGGGSAVGVGSHAAVAVVILRAAGRAVDLATRVALGVVVLRGMGYDATVAGRGAVAVVILRGVGRGEDVATADHPQWAVPVGDVSDGGWTNELGSTVDLYASIDEATPSDADYVRSSLSPLVVDECRLLLAPLDDPLTGNGHALRLRCGKDLTGGDRIDLEVRLYAADGTTVLASRSFVDLDALADVGITLTTAEADAIPSADYGALVLGLRAVKA